MIAFPGTSWFVRRAEKTWAGVLEVDEIRAVAIGYTWGLQIVPAALIAFLCALYLQDAGASTLRSLVPFLFLVLFDIIVVSILNYGIRKARRLVARRLGISDRAARLITFQGRDKFYASVARARAKT